MWKFTLLILWSRERERGERKWDQNNESNLKTEREKRGVNYKLEEADILIVTKRRSKLFGSTIPTAVFFTSPSVRRDIKGSSELFWSIHVYSLRYIIIYVFKTFLNIIATDISPVLDFKKSHARAEH